MLAGWGSQGPIISRNGDHHSSRARAWFWLAGGRGFRGRITPPSLDTNGEVFVWSDGRSKGYHAPSSRSNSSLRRGYTPQAATDCP